MITYELSLSKIMYERKVYNYLDFLGSIGGLFTALLKIMGMFVIVFQYRGGYFLLMNDSLDDQKSG